MSAALLVRCPHCAAAPEEACKTRGGRPVRDGSHRTRWDRFSRAYRTEQFLVRMKRDDTRFGLAEGDVLRCIAYPYDAKVSVIQRESDGYDPECNQYHHDVELLRFVERAS